MFTLTIKTDNAAFHDENGESDGQEIARLLLGVSHEVAAGFTDGPIIDLNGNRVGHFNLED